jgi:hypothetical protein
MKNKRNSTRPLCCIRDVTFSVNDNIYTGTIQNMGHYGASVISDKPVKISEGKKIRISILDDNQEEVKNAEVVWSDESGFGAKFTYPVE